MKFLQFKFVLIATLIFFTQDRINGYHCSCMIGFTGDDCGINIDDCEMDPCLNGATCNVSCVTIAVPSQYQPSNYSSFDQFRI